MRFFFFLIIVSMAFAPPVAGQILDNSETNLFGEAPFFNEQFIRQNGIREIRGSISLKKQLQKIKPLGLIQQFEFDENGRLVKHLETHFAAGASRDTTVIYYQYDDAGQLTVKRVNDAQGFFSYQYEYDQDGNMIKETYYRDENAGPSKAEFRQGRQVIIRSERFEYSRTGKQLKKRYFNSQDRPYLDQTFYYDDYGNLTTDVTTYVVTRRKSRISYQYDDFGRVEKMTDFSTLSGDNTITHEFSYDEIGNVLEDKISRNGQLTTVMQYLYTETMLLKAQLIKDEATIDITIIQYDYEFY